jgi:hypothetical protein
LVVVAVAAAADARRDPTKFLLLLLLLIPPLMACGTLEAMATWRAQVTLAAVGAAADTRTSTQGHHPGARARATRDEQEIRSQHRTPRRVYYAQVPRERVGEGAAASQAAENENVQAGQPAAQPASQQGRPAGQPASRPASGRQADTHLPPASLPPAPLLRRAVPILEEAGESYETDLTAASRRALGVRPVGIVMPTRGPTAVLMLWRTLVRCPGQAPNCGLWYSASLTDEARRELGLGCSAGRKSPSSACMPAPVHAERWTYRQGHRGRRQRHSSPSVALSQHSTSAHSSPLSCCKLRLALWRGDVQSKCAWGGVALTPWVPRPPHCLLGVTGVSAYVPCADAPLPPTVLRPLRTTFLVRWKKRRTYS